MTVVSRVHWSFWLIAIFMLVWNVMGAVNFMMQMNPENIASYRQAEQAIIQGRPWWATLGFAVAVFGGAVGCLLLLLRRALNLAWLVFLASLFGVVITSAHTLGLGIEFSTGEVIGIIFMPLAVAVFLLWYVKYVAGKGWGKTQ